MKPSRFSALMRTGLTLCGNDNHYDRPALLSLTTS